MRKSSSWLLRYGVALLAVELAVSSLLIPAIGRGVGAVLFFAVVVSAWFGGLGPGLAATALTIGAAVALLIYFGQSFEAWRIVSLSLFGVGGALISALVEALHAARRRTEASRRWLEAVLRSVGDAVIVADDQGAVSFLNPVAQDLTGWSQHEAAGRPLEEVLRLVAEGTQEPIESPVARALRDGRAVVLDHHTTLVARDGTERPIDDSAAPIRDDQGDVAGAVLVFRDISGRRRIEIQKAELLARERAARAEAEAANQAKDHFLAVLSHELRTPLTPVLMAVSSALEDGRIDIPETLRPILNLVRSNVELEAKLIDDLLDLSRIARGKLELKREVLDAHALICRGVEICRDGVKAAGLDLRLDLSAAEHHVEADPARLQQVVWNLIKNAVKFTPRGGRLTISTHNEPAEDHGNGNGAAGVRLVVEVADTGIGIQPEMLSRIFDAFEQGNSLSWAQRSGGLGLGLAIGRSIIEAHGGRLIAFSEGAQKGATFRFELATVPAPAPSPPEPEPLPEPPAPRPMRLLLVEDDESTLQVMSRVLRGRGYQVTTANAVSSALACAAAGRFDLVISDLGLPDGSGLDLMRALRTQHGLAGIALTGFGMNDDLEKSKEAGFEAHLTKPIDVQTLDAMIQQVAAS